MKILDRYILTTYLKTFISVFVILVLIFVLQTIWLYIKELAGKDLEIDVIFKFLIYFMPKLMPLVLPLTILLTSIMVFGNFAENYEFAAMKSTGISLQRAMSGLSVFIVLLAITTFFFSNNVIPWAEYNSYNLRRNIAKLKPAMAIAEGQFNEIESTPYNIKVEKKSGDRGQFLHDIVIHMKGRDGRKNQTTIIAKNGELVGKEDSNILKLVLFDGNYYNDIPAKKIKERKKQPFAKSTFDKYIINIDLSNLNNVDIEDKSYSNKYSMLNLGELDYTIDSLTVEHDKTMRQFSQLLYQRSSIYKNKKPVKEFSEDDDITAVEAHEKVADIDTIPSLTEEKETTIDSIFTGNILDLFDTTKKSQFTNSAASAINSVHQLIENKKTTLKPKRVWFNKHVIAFHEKLALGFACIILFFVGAPLGALIRKGGLGLPMVIAILLFLTYHFIGIFALNSAKSGDFNPILASWFSTLIMLPLGIFLTKRATADRGLFDFDSIIIPLKRLFNIKENNKESFKFLHALKHDELIHAINDYEALGYSEATRFEAIKVLNSRDITTQELREKEVSISKNFEISQNITKDYTNHSKFAIILYAISALLLLVFFVSKNNKLPSLATASIQLSIVALVLYVIYYIKSILNLYAFYSNIKKENRKPNIFMLLLGLPLYMITYVFLRFKIKEDLKQNCLDSLK
ncbi:LptF/LptG family permease [Algibacter sp. 2305UL17-15]|uniref:LptF/LptG family permease n=1 Tax=Algibacter sp. 2305UL17-15 TaxID=3231268 RepID=UPI00345AF405